MGREEQIELFVSFMKGQNAWGAFKKECAYFQRKERRQTYMKFLKTKNKPHFFILGAFSWWETTQTTQTPQNWAKLDTGWIKLLRFCNIK